MKKEETEVSQWLVDNSARKYIDAFYNAHYYEKADVTEDAIKKVFYYRVNPHSR